MSIDSELVTLLRSQIIISPSFTTFKNTLCRICIFPPVEKQSTTGNLEENYKKLLSYISNLISTQQQILAVIDIQNGHHSWSSHGKIAARALASFDSGFQNCRIKHCFVLSSSNVLQRARTSMSSMKKEIAKDEILRFELQQVTLDGIGKILQSEKEGAVSPDNVNLPSVEIPGCLGGKSFSTFDHNQWVDTRLEVHRLYSEIQTLHTHLQSFGLQTHLINPATQLTLSLTEEPQAKNLLSHHESHYRVGF